jgi:hypothetical protein
MSLWLGAARKLRILQQTPEKKASSEPSTKDGIEAARLCASLFRVHLWIDTVS